MAGLRRGRRGRKPGWSTDAHDIVDRLFAYGELRSGQQARNMIENHVDSWQPATMEGRIYLLSDGYPALVPGSGDLVTGEVVALKDLASVFALLDAFEGESYTRIMQKARLADGSESWTWVYALADPSDAEHAEQVVGGDWVEWQARTRPR